MDDQLRMQILRRLIVMSLVGSTDYDYACFARSLAVQLELPLTQEEREALETSVKDQLTNIGYPSIS